MAPFAFWSRNPLLACGLTLFPFCSLRPPLGPSQYVSTAVSGHVSLWSYEALVDFLEFFSLFFRVSNQSECCWISCWTFISLPLQRAVLFGRPGDKSLVEMKAYNDMVPLGWYTFPVCWMKSPLDLHPPVLEPFTTFSNFLTSHAFIFLSFLSVCG